MSRLDWAFIVCMSIFLYACIWFAAAWAWPS